MPKFKNPKSSKAAQFETLNQILLQFELSLNLGKQLSKVKLKKLNQEFKKIVKEVNNNTVKPMI